MRERAPAPTCISSFGNVEGTAEGVELDRKWLHRRWAARTAAGRCAPMFQVDRLEHVAQAHECSRCNVRSPKTRVGSGAVKVTHAWITHPWGAQAQTGIRFGVVCVPWWEARGLVESASGSASVVFPEPLGPSSVTNSPWAAANVTSSRTRASEVFGQVPDVYLRHSTYASGSARPSRSRQRRCRVELRRGRRPTDARVLHVLARYERPQLRPSGCALWNNAIRCRSAFSHDGRGHRNSAHPRVPYFAGQQAHPFTSWRAILSLSLRPRKGITSGYLNHEQQSAVGSRAPGPELEGMVRGGGGGGAGAAAAVAHQLMQNPLVGAIVLLVLVVAVWWVWNKYF